MWWPHGLWSETEHLYVQFECAIYLQLQRTWFAHSIRMTWIKSFVQEYDFCSYNILFLSAKYCIYCTRSKLIYWNGWIDEHILQIINFSREICYVYLHRHLTSYMCASWNRQMSLIAPGRTILISVGWLHTLKRERLKIASYYNHNKMLLITKIRQQR